MIEEAPSTRSEPEYRKQPEHLRLAYEERLARCELNQGAPGNAVTLMEPWENARSDEARWILVEALAEMREDDRAKVLIEGLSRNGKAQGERFVFTRGLKRYRGQGWFIDAGLQAWRPSEDISLPRLIAALTGKDLLKFSVAWADKKRPSGEFVFWLGRVRDAQIDRDRNRTTLVVEGADEIDANIENLELTQIEFQNTPGGVKARPTFRTSKEEIKVIELNNHEFSVEVIGSHEEVVDLSYVRVLGVYDGHDGQRPTVKGRHIFSVSLKLR